MVRSEDKEGRAPAWNIRKPPAEIKNKAGDYSNWPACGRRSSRNRRESRQKGLEDCARGVGGEAGAGVLEKGEGQEREKAGE